jgi:hypothetical protein
MSASIWSPDGTVPSDTPIDYVFREYWYDVAEGQTLVNLTGLAYTPGVGSLKISTDGLYPLQVGVDYLETSGSPASITLLQVPTDPVRLYAVVGRAVNVSIDSIDASLVTYTGPDGEETNLGTLAGPDGAKGIGFDGGTVDDALRAGIVSGSYVGTWNATTNTPSLASGVGVQGAYFIVSVAGTTTLDGISSWAVGDQARFSGTVWEKIPLISSLPATAVTLSAVTGLAATQVQAAIAELAKYTPPGAGGVDGTLQERLNRQIFADSYITIQAALDYARGLGYSCEVIVGPGIHNVGTKLQVRGNVALIGQNNWLTRIFQTTLNQPVVEIPDNEDHCEVRNLFLDYSGGAPTAGANALDIRHTQNCVVSRVFINGGYNCLAFTRNSGIGNRSGNHLISNIFCYNYVNAGYYNDGVLDIFVCNFRFAALDNLNYGLNGGICLVGNVEANVFVGGDITTGDYSIRTYKNDANPRSRLNAPYFNRFIGVFFDSATYGSLLFDLVHTDFIGCWFASAGYDQSIPSPYSNLRDVAGLALSNCDTVRFIGGDIYNNGGYGVLQYNNNRNVSFLGTGFRRNRSGVVAGVPVGNGPAVQILSPSTNFDYSHCVFDPYQEDGTTLSYQTQSINLQVGANDWYKIIGNTMRGCTLVDNSTGTNRFVDLNIGYNNPIYRGTYTPVISSSTNSLTAPGACLGAYVVRDGYCDVVFDCQITTNGTGAGTIRITLPFVVSNFALAGQFSGVWRSSSTGTTGITYTEGGLVTYVTLMTMANAYPGADSTRFIGSIRYAI